MKSIRPVPAKALTLSHSREELQLHKKNTSCRQETKNLCLNVFKIALLAGAVAEDGENDHNQHRDEDDDDRNLDEREQEADENYQLFEKCDDQKN